MLRGQRVIPTMKTRGCQVMRWLVAGVALGLGCGQGGGVDRSGDASADAGCAWGRCGEAGVRGVRCVATGVADGSWLTARWEDRDSPGCTMVPEELRAEATPGRFEAGSAPIGELRCEGLRPGAATLRVRLRVRLLDASGSTPAACHCEPRWDVGMRLVVDGREARNIDWLGESGARADGSCRRGPESDQRVPVVVGASGRLSAWVELVRCARSGATTCVFLEGTGLSVEQRWGSEG